MSFHRLDAEQALLGALLMDAALLERLSALEPQHFYDPVHHRLFAEVRRLAASGRATDALSLKAWAVADPGCKELGGAVYLMRLMEGAAVLTSHAISYAELIRDAAARRALAHALKTASDALSDGEVLEVAAALEAELHAVGEHGEAVGSDAREAAAACIASLDRSAIQTGLPSLDARWGGLYHSELTILAGRPSMGKTTLAAQIARNIADTGAVVHFASLDMPKEALACRSMSARSYRREYATQRVEYYHIRNGSNVSRALLQELANEMPRTLYIDDRPAQTIAQLEQAARSTRRRGGRLDAIVVDYLQLMRSQRTDGRVQEVSDISAGLKAIAKRLKVPVVALSQLSRGVEGRENKRPGLSDLRESGAIEQDADVVAAVYREEYYLSRQEPSSGDAAEWHAWRKKCDAIKHDMEVITLKQRGGPTGTDKLIAHLAYDTILDRGAA